MLEKYCFDQTFFRRMGKEKYLDFHKDESHETSTLTVKSIPDGGQLLKLRNKMAREWKIFSPTLN